MYIQYLITFQSSLIQVNKTLNFMLAFFDLSNKVNIIYLIFIEKLNLIVQFTNVSIQKIDDTIFKIYKMIVAIFSVIN